MNRNLSIDKRFSLNGSNIASPIAESTCLTTNGISSVPQFQWGSISPKNRSSPTSHFNVSERHSTTNLQLGKTKIDPRIYADIHSKGLASRIVKYHENGNRLNRSMSMIHLHNNPTGHQYKNTDVQIKVGKQNIAVTRMVTPEKSMFYGNTLSGLLRSNSIVGLKKTDEEISRENRPIMHPPPTESDVGPTRSVLEVLKEISRKRINNEDLDKNDYSKKYCNRESNDCDVSNPPCSIGYNSIQSHSIYSNKRQRDNGLNSQVIDLTQTSTLQTAIDPRHINNRLSPEQIHAKKRICSYNNDITSSLSSTTIHSNKRKVCVQNRVENKLKSAKTIGTSLELEQNSFKNQSNNLIFDNPVNTNSSHTLVSSSSLPTIIQKQTTKAITSTSGYEKNIKITDETPPFCEVLFTNNKITSQNHKSSQPKITLFNVNYDDCPKQEINNYNINNDDESETTGIQFIKPKTASSVTNCRHPLIEKTQKSKLALMLCSLRGEIYTGEESIDKTDSNESNNKGALQGLNSFIEFGKSDTIITSTVNLPTSNTAVSSSAGLGTVTTTTTTPLTISSIIPIENGKPEGVPTLSVPSTVGIGSSESTITSLIENKSPVVTTLTSIIPVTTITTSPRTPLTTSDNRSPNALEGFKLTANSTNPTNVKNVSPLVGIKLTPQTETNTVVTPTLSFGTASNPPISSIIPISFAQPVPVVNGFPLGLNLPKSLPSATALNTTINLDSKINTMSNNPIMTATTMPTVNSSFGNKILTTESLSVLFPNAAPTIATTSQTSLVQPTSNLTTISSFGSIPTNTIVPAQTFGAIPTFGTNFTETPKKFTFGSQPVTTNDSIVPSLNTTTTTSTTGSKIGSIKPLFSLNTQTKPVVTSSSVQLQTSSAASATGGFSFGGATTNTNNTSSPFSFNGSNELNSTSAPSGVDQSTKPSFLFGSKTAPSEETVKSVINSPNNMFSFNVEKTTLNSSNNGSTGFSFGNVNNQGNQLPSSMFGTTEAKTSNAAAFNFGLTGQVSVSKPQESSPPSFYGNSSESTSTSIAPAQSNGGLFSFGNNSVNKPATTGGFSFSTGIISSTTASAPTSTTVLNTITTTPNAMTGVVKPSFGYGSSDGIGTDANIGNNNINLSSTPLFGQQSVNSTTQMNKNIFGSLVNNSNSNQSKTFTFGSNYNATTSASLPQASNNSNLFSAAFNNSKSSNTSGFSFNSATTNANIQAKPIAITAPTVAFGSSANDNRNAIKPFAFAANTITGNSGNNPTSIFGGGANTQVTNNATAPSTFNFTANSNLNANPSASNNANIFSTSGAIVSSDRPIRRATRRLQKP